MWALSFISIYDDGFTLLPVAGLLVVDKTRHTQALRNLAIWQSKWQLIIYGIIDECI